MRIRRSFGFLLLISHLCHVDAISQMPATLASQQPPSGGLQQRVEALSTAMATAQQRIAESQRQMQQMQEELLLLRQQIAETHSLTPAEPPAAVPIAERQDALESAVKVLDQSKVESHSKYPVRITGLLLFNGFLNKGLGDNIDIPVVALRPTNTSGNGSLGGSFRQTILGLEGNGPKLAGGRTSASVDFDFFSGTSYTNYGTSAGMVRFRTARIAVEWADDLLEVGMTEPLVSPLSPTSFATVAEPSLAASGNLWTWAPQIRYQHQIHLPSDNRLRLEFGLLDSASAGYNSNQLYRTSSPAEQSQQPSYETRVSFARAGDRSLQLGVGGYYSRQTYPGYAGYAITRNLDSWSANLDWRIPISSRVELSGEAYRGRSLGGLGGGVYKDVIAGVNPATGLYALRGLNATGGWTQLKARFSSSLESNASIGLDDGFARDFHALILPSTASAAQLRARNRMFVANVVFRPKTYLILSPEYRRVWTWPISGQANTLGIYTFSIGYQF
jgi:hypothetical protein